MLGETANNFPLVSVLVPAYNAQSFLDEAIQSVLKQTYSNFELLIVDDCSQDATYEIAQKWALLDRRVQVIQNPKNLGIAGNRNRVLGLAKGKYIAWQDADDISLPERLALQTRFLEDHPQMGIVGGGLELFTDNRVLGYRHYPQSDHLIRRYIFRYSPITQPAAMIRAKVFQLANLPTVLVRYRVSETSATAISQRRMEINTLKIRFKYARSSAYHIGFLGVLFNAAHFISLWIIPANLKRWLFTKLRDVKR
jgi:glycosyltransferase involved in cell wall biosynthesis